MTRKLFTVEETFTIHGRGVMLVPGVVPQGNERFRIGDSLRLVRPDGSQVHAVIAGIDFFNVPAHGGFAILVGLSKEDVPIGTEVWYSDPDP